MSVGISLAVLAEVSMMSCASLTYKMSSCSWFELDDPDAVATDSRVTIGEEATCTEVGAPGQYQLHRALYTVEFWNGERWYPELYVRAQGPDGTRLRIQSPAFLELQGGGAISPAARERRGVFDYALLAEFRSQYQPTIDLLEFVVVGPDGRTLGTESVRVTKKTGGRYRAYY